MRRIPRACGETPGEPDVSHGTPVSSGIVVRFAFVTLPDVTDGTEFISDYSLHLAIAICLCVSVDRRVCHVQRVPVTVHFTLLNLQSINCLVL